jgi:hypothetical protein
MNTLVKSDLLDRYAERAALTVYCAVNITLCLEKLGKPASFEVVDPEKSEKYVISAKSVNNIRLWEKYYAYKGVTLDTGSLDTVRQRAQGYMDFLINDHKGRYRFIERKADLEIFNDMIVTSAIIRTMRTRSTEERIVDPEVRQKVARLMWQSEFNVGMARGVNHAKKHDEDVQDVLAATYEGFQLKFDESFKPVFIEPLPALPSESLPALPDGVSHALTWYVG